MVFDICIRTDARGSYKNSSVTLTELSSCSFSMVLLGNEVNANRCMPTKEHKKMCRHGIHKMHVN